MGRISDAFDRIRASGSPGLVAYVRTLAKTLGPEKIVLVNLSGRGDKDVHSVEKALNAAGAR